MRRRTLLPFAWIPPALCLASPTLARQAAPPPARPAPKTVASGVLGALTLGPIAPAERIGQPNSRPVAGVEVIARDADGKIVARQRTDANGRYKLLLSPGKYQIVFPGRPGRIGAGRSPLTQPVTITAGRFTQADRRYDTGIR